jgi:hypothetical protein
VVIGLMVAITGGFLAIVFLLGALLTANPCGAFGDACDDYGTTPTSFVVMLALTFVAVVAALGGVVVMVVGHGRRNRRSF